MLSICLSMMDDEEDKITFEELYNQYRQKFYADALAILHNEQDAEDVVQQSFFTILMNFKKIMAISCHKRRRYLIILNRNNSLRLYHVNRRNSKFKVKLDDLDSPVEDAFFEQYDFDQLVSKILALPPKYKDVLILYYIDEYSSKDIAKMLGITNDNVRKRIERAKRKLLESLEGDDCDEGE